ncbi:MAG: DivIVA domain-containing protein, partial [Acidimicrobiia bacterium]
PMASDITPDDIRRAEFRAVRRGLDADEVSSFLERVAAEVDKLEKERERLATKLGEYADRDLASEFESLGREVAVVLQSAKEAADSMRERATMDAARWRSEAMAEVEAMGKEARSDAEALRGDAWATGTELLNQSLAEARRVRGEAEQDVLSVMGEAEREAHRLTSTARREAEDVIRAAMMDSEKLASEAKKRHDDLIEQAYRQSESAQERTRALEERREELMLELETVRSTLSRLEGSLEERREDLDLSAESTSVRVVPARTEPDEETWQLGETVRIIPPVERPPGRAPRPTQDRPPPPAKEAGEERRADPFDEHEVEEALPPEPEPTSKEIDEPEPVEEARPEPEREPEPEPQLGPDDVGALFASLRGTPSGTITVHTATAPEVEEVEAEAAQPASTAPRNEVIEERDARLLPITNRALRGVKKAVTDAQNVALDSLRLDDTWHPEGRVLAEMMQADLKGLWAESYSAGHAAAEEMTGSKLKRKDTPPSNAAEAFGEDLAGAVSSALIDAGDGQREKQSATSRVFRGWRTDEAERRVRELSLVGYHRGVVDSAGDETGFEWVASGTPCSACRGAAAAPESHLPPVHAGCECTLVLVVG